MRTMSTDSTADKINWPRTKIDIPTLLFPVLRDGKGVLRLTPVAVLPEKYTSEIERIEKDKDFHIWAQHPITGKVNIENIPPTREELDKMWRNQDEWARKHGYDI